MGQDITRPVSLFVDIGHKVMTYSVTDPGQVTYQGIFEVPSQIVISEVSLLDNLRKFIPLLVYLMILLRLVVVDPTIRWMLQNKIYKAKYHHDKVKLH